MAQRPSTPELPPALHEQMQRIRAQAIEEGLNFYEVLFQLIPFDVMNQVAAYGGFPVRYPHWRWGMEYEKLSKRDAYGLGRIYEMVINTNPVYAYLQESNSLTDQKLVMAHVYGHADFFKNNAWFRATNRKMLDEMANHATRVRRHADQHGHEAVERFLDACLSLEWLIDPFAALQPPHTLAPPAQPPQHFEPDRLPSKDYLDPFINPRHEMDRQRQAHAAAQAAAKARSPERPSRDVLAFLLRHAPLEPWQQDLLTIVRDEALYFVPQAMTKVMNEGWASYWHSHLMTHHFADASEIVCYCDQHAGVMHMPQGNFNPYKVGIELFRDVERRWNTGQHGAAYDALDTLGAKDRHDDRSAQGRDKIFQVRAVYNDVTFIDDFFTEEFCDAHRFFTVRADDQGHQRLTSRDFAKVKATLLHHLTNRGEPFIYVADANYLNRGELYLTHSPAGTPAANLELDADRAARVLSNLRTIWGRPVHLQALYRDEMTLLTCQKPEEPPTRQRIADDTPPPAHLV